VLPPGSPPAGEARPVIGRHHEHVVETREGTRIGPLLAAQALDELAAHPLGNPVTARGRLAPLEAFGAATPESPAIPALMLLSPS
jgi:hypothetical protein